MDLINPLKHRVPIGELGDLTNEYNLGPMIGQGSFGIVFQGSRKSDKKPVALKFVKRNQIRHWVHADVTDPQIQEPAEVAYLRELDKVEGVICLRGVHYYPEGVMIIMERPPMAMELFEVVSQHGVMAEKVALHIFRQIVDAVIDMWTNYKICHGDLKDDNVLLSLEDYRVYIIDFGLALRDTGQPHNRLRGHDGYVPPEFSDPTKRFPLQATVWSLGIILFGLMHWDSVDEYTKSGSPLPFRQNISLLCRDIINGCLHPDPTQRMPLLRLKSHPWLHQEEERVFNGISSHKTEELSSDSWIHVKRRGHKRRKGDGGRIGGLQ